MTPENTTLDELCDLASDHVNPADVPEAVYLGLEHLPSSRFVVTESGTASDVSSSKSRFQPGDVLYGKLRPYLDKAVVASRAGVCTTELLVLRPKADIDPVFLASVIHSPQFTDFAMSGVTGAHHPRTSWSHIRSFALPNFNQDERSAIAAIVSSVQAALTRCEASIAANESLSRVAMRELFARGVHGEKQKETEIGPMPKNWEPVMFGQVREWLQYGTSVRCSSDAGRYPVLRIPNIEPGRVNATGLKYCDASAAEVESYRLEVGDLLFIRTNGVLDRLGACSVYSGDPADALFASYLIRARIKTSKADPRFLALFFGSDRGTQIVASRATPAADGKYNLNTGAIDSFMVPLPPDLDQQREIVEILDAIAQKIDLHKRKKAVLEELFKALLHKLMTGEIRVSDLDLSALHAPTEVRR